MEVLAVILRNYAKQKVDLREFHPLKPQEKRAVFRPVEVKLLDFLEATQGIRLAGFIQDRSFTVFSEPLLVDSGSARDLVSHLLSQAPSS